MISSSEAVFFWQELERESSVLGVPCVCVYPSLFLYIWELADDGALCQLWWLCPVPAGCVGGGAMLLLWVLGGAPVGGNQAEFHRLMRQQL